MHLALGAIPFFLLYALCRGAWLGGALATVPALAAALLVGHYSTSGIGSGGRSLREVAHYSATGLDFVTRHPRHGLESFVFLGWLTPLLALAGLAVLVRARRWWLVAVLAVGALVPMLLALGTHFPLYSTLWHHLPPLRYPRVPERQMPVACLALAALAAFAVARLRWVLVVALLVLVAADLRVSIYQAAAAQPGRRAYAGLSAPGPAARAAGPAPERPPRQRLPLVRPGRPTRAAGRLLDDRAGGRGPALAAAGRAELRRLAARRRRAAAPARRPLRRLPPRPRRRDRLVRVARAARPRLRPGRARRRRHDARARPLRRIVTRAGAEQARRLLRKDGRAARRATATRPSGLDGQARVRLTTRDPVRLKLSLHGQAVHSLRVTKPTSIRLGGTGWWLVYVDVNRADRGLRVRVEPVT